MELHQDEITSMPMEILTYLVNSCNILNDLRTIFLVHNKNFLTLLSDDLLMADYLSPLHHSIIKKHRIRSFQVDRLLENESQRDEILKNKDRWLVKPCTLGKGEGIVFGKNVSSEKWSTIFNESLISKEFVIQEYVEQEKFGLLHHSKGEMQCQLNKYQMVGCLLCFNTEFLGN